LQKNKGYKSEEIYKNTLAVYTFQPCFHHVREEGTLAEAWKPSVALLLLNKTIDVKAVQ